MLVRTRFAPSPSGYLHIGSARTALFNYLFARHAGGSFVLRVEDTDRTRSTPESIAAILDSLRWLGLDWDEGPFFQSKRAALHQEAGARLLAEGRAYRCFCTPEELDAKRQTAREAGRKPLYDRTCRERTDEPGNASFVVRFKAPVHGETVVQDLIRGRVVFRNEELDDLILLRSDGTPTYNFCVVVDDANMQITHVIRGEDHLSNTPKQVQIYEALGFPVPAFAHVPLIHGRDGGRLSKRHGATAVATYREMGYLPDALLNYLVRLGWSHGDQELFSRGEMVEKFSLDNVGHSAGVFNPEKLEWVNFQHLKALPPADLASLVKPFIEERGWPIPGDDTWLSAMVTTLQERAKTLVDLVDRAAYYLEDSVEIDPKATAKHLAKLDAGALRELAHKLETAEWTHAGIEAAFHSVMERHNLKLGKLAQPARVALTGGTVSPGIFEVIEVIGRERSVARLRAAIPLARQPVD